MSFNDDLISAAMPENGSERTSAQRLVDFFGLRGIGLTQLNGRQIQPLYDALNKTIRSALDHPPKFQRLAAVAEPVKDRVWGVIVETRQHPALEYVVDCFFRELGIGIQIFHGTENESFIRNSSVSELIGQGKLTLTSLQTATLSPTEYNALLLSKHFWSAIQGRKKILVFQTDTILCRCSDFKIDDFLEFDYVGAKWPRKRPVGMVIDGGNGGLSLRDWRKTLDCLERFPAHNWPGGEDGYFAFHMELAGYRVGKPEDCARFASQGEFLERSFGAHKIAELNESALKQFLAYCPEAQYVLNTQISL